MKKRLQATLLALVLLVSAAAYAPPASAAATNDFYCYAVPGNLQPLTESLKLKAADIS